MSREETIAYGESFGIPAPVKNRVPIALTVTCSVAVLRRGRWKTRTRNRSKKFMTKSDPDTPDEPEYVEIGFENGILPHSTVKRLLQFSLSSDLTS